MEKLHILKIAACLTAILMGTGAGVYFSFRLRMREGTLRELTGILQEMALLIRYRTLPINEIFNELSRYEFIRGICGSAQSGGDFRKNWIAASENLTELSENERSTVKFIGQSLGASDVEGQLSMLEINVQLLSKYGEEAHEQYMKKGKLYRSIGVLSGIFMAILII